MANERICERCKEGITFAKDERYCVKCRKQVLAELKEAGYLTHAPRHGSYRGPGSAEDIHATKRGG